jgi:hypothetical protein
MSPYAVSFIQYSALDISTSKYYQYLHKRLTETKETVSLCLITTELAYVHAAFSCHGNPILHNFRAFNSQLNQLRLYRAGLLGLLINKTKVRMWKEAVVT